MRDRYGPISSSLPVGNSGPWKGVRRGVRQDQIDNAEGTVYPGWTKIVCQEPSARIELAVPEERDRMTFLESASEQVKILAENGIDIGKTDYMF